jgi:pimeloyl-ACP methyl ester carboxylesterase
MQHPYRLQHSSTVTNLVILTMTSNNAKNKSAFSWTKILKRKPTTPATASTPHLPSMLLAKEAPNGGNIPTISVHPATTLQNLQTDSPITLGVPIPGGLKPQDSDQRSMLSTSSNGSAERASTLKRFKNILTTLPRQKPAPTVSPATNQLHLARRTMIKELKSRKPVRAFPHLSNNMKARIGINMLLLAVGVAGAIEWGPCPEGQIYEGTFSIWDCAFLNFPMDRSDLTKGNVTSFVRRGYATEPTGKSMWGIAGGPGESTLSFVPMFDYFMMLDPSLTTYLVDARGIGLSSPLHVCKTTATYFNPYNETAMRLIDECNRETIAADSARFPYFTTYHAALDIQGVMVAVQPHTISILAVSYGTYLANTLLQLPGIRADVVVYDGPISADRWLMEFNARQQTMVTLDSIRMCVIESAVCKSFLGEMGHIPQMVKDAIVDGSLKCLSKLPWLAAEDGNFLTSLYNNFMNPNTRKAMLGPFWHRLYRCSDSDAEQLTNFHTVRQQELSTGGVVDPLRHSMGYGTNQGGDLYSLAGSGSLTYDQVLEHNVRQFTVEGADMQLSYARDVSGWPFPAANPLTHSYAAPTATMHMLVGTLDHNTPVGQSQWLKDGLGPNVDARVYVVPYAGHGIIEPANMCALRLATAWLSLKTDLDTSCLATSVAPPDWDGSEAATQNDLALKYFGTTDLWNNGMVFDTTSATVQSSSECEWESSNVGKVFLSGVMGNHP